MTDPVFFDHIEVHVQRVAPYGEFLGRLFRGGRFRQISASGTSMFVTPDGLNIEVKARVGDGPLGGAGFCLPCVRLAGARHHLDDLGLEIFKEIENPEGRVYFFRDPEGIEWHAKDYVHRDRFINW